MGALAGMKLFKNCFALKGNELRGVPYGQKSYKI